MNILSALRIVFPQAILGLLHVGSGLNSELVVTIDGETVSFPSALRLAYDV